MDEKEKNATVDYWLGLLDAQGAVCMTVKDGHMLAFKRQVLQNILNDNPDKEELVIFVKRPDLPKG